MSDEDARMTDELERLLDVPIVFGLKAQGHLPTIERMLSERKTWREIAEAIGWDEKTAQFHYEKWAKEAT